MKIWTDANPNIVAWIAEDGTMEMKKLIPSRTNNEAEYIAVHQALLSAPIGSNIEILSDSKLIVNQLGHRWHIKEERLREMAFGVWRTVAHRELSVIYTWVPREENKAGKLLG